MHNAQPENMPPLHEQPKPQTQAEHAIDAERLATTKQHYNSVPYESHPYPNTHPEHLYCIGKMLGLEVKSPVACRVLELGCAAGGNLMPIAINNPKSECVGIDISDVEIKQGLATVEALKLDNIRLKAMSITDIGSEWGTFDYIITHGILSWVPKPVQRAIFAVSKQCLNPGGIAYISYNTLPGWNLIKSMREMMLYHTQNIEDNNKKVDQAIALLNFILKSVDDNNKQPYYEVIRQELDNLKKHRRTYFLHDHLEHYNEPFYFHQVAKMATDHGLNYLCDANLSSMYTGYLQEDVRKAFAAISSDVIKTEQYMDFIRNRRFRMSLFCHDIEKPNRQLNGHSLMPLCVATGVKLETNNAAQTLDAIDCASKEKLTFKHVNSQFSTDNPLQKSLLLTLLGRYGKPMHVEAAIEQVISTYGGNDEKNERDALLNFLMKLYFINAVSLHYREGQYIDSVSKKPWVSGLARYQASRQTWVTNRRAEVLNVNDLDRAILTLADGTHTVDEITDAVCEKFKNQELNLQVKGKAQAYSSALDDSISQTVQQKLHNYARSALLVK